MDIPTEKFKELANKYNLNLIIIFGSYITENFNSNSDIDIAVQAENVDLINNNKLKLLNEISALFNHRETDLILLNHADPLLKFNIAQEGKLIYQAEEGLFNIFKVRAMSEHNDAQKFYKLDKKFIENYLQAGDKNGQQRTNPPQVN
jgi:predicted nucleotidyltransferase